MWFYSYNNKTSYAIKSIPEIEITNDPLCNKESLEVADKSY